MQYGNFIGLDMYKKCREFRKMISKIIKQHFPTSEKNVLSNQILRSSRSITANIAEGYGRFYYQDNIRFCRIARGSLEETLEHLITAFDEKYIDAATLKETKIQHENCLKLINGYIRYLQISKRGEKDEK